MIYHPFHCIWQKEKKNLVYFLICNFINPVCHSAITHIPHLKALYAHLLLGLISCPWNILNLAPWCFGKRILIPMNCWCVPQHFILKLRDRGFMQCCNPFILIIGLVYFSFENDSTDLLLRTKVCPDFSFTVLVCLHIVFQLFFSLMSLSLPWQNFSRAV